MAAQTYGVAADSALRASGGRKNGFIRKFLLAARGLGRIISDTPGLRQSLGDLAETCFHNLHSLWGQFADIGDRTLAREAYDVLTIWEPLRTDRRWDLLRRAYEPDNCEALRRMGQDRLLRREASVRITSDSHVQTITRTVYRRSFNSTGCTPAPSLTICLPLHRCPGPPSFDANSVAVISGAAVFSLVIDSELSVTETDPPVLSNIHKGLWQYREMWGSNLLLYRLTVRMEQNLFPVRIQMRTLRGAPMCFVTVDDNGTVIEIGCDPHDSRDVCPTAWLSEVSIQYRLSPVPSGILVRAGGFFGKRIPLDIFNQLVQRAS